ncbi:FkbM family methyltransferase [Bradyrhizobium sp. AS23.2]|uniref:FkbM family methyltransferase n=1 Tax=Bradyrhizobium sp. AS23.2 TaxID=1680155 RepID=UPI00093A5F5C|nr:FkbM family methyltransferase [Bradyrhizobium sp. AS23.2]
MQTIFDIGMYDGTDTEYYLESGFRVVAVEANPELIDGAMQKFCGQVRSGQLILCNAAISENGEAVELVLAGTDLGSSSVFRQLVEKMRPIGSIKVPGVTFSDLLERYGVPYYLKIDIEGSDRFCVLSLRPETAPRFLSFEVNDDAGELIEHAEAIGFKRFKIINQVSFRELANQDCLYDRLTRRAVRYLGYSDAGRIRRAGRFFRSGHSSGPLPWLSDGRWHSARETCTRLKAARTSNRLRDWYDIHAALG